MTSAAATALPWFTGPRRGSGLHRDWYPTSRLKLDQLPLGDHLSGGQGRHM